MPAWICRHEKAEGAPVVLPLHPRLYLPKYLQCDIESCFRCFGIQNFQNCVLNGYISIITQQDDVINLRIRRLGFQNLPKIPGNLWSLKVENDLKKLGMQRFWKKLDKVSWKLTSKRENKTKFGIAAHEYMVVKETRNRGNEKLIHRNVFWSSLGKWPSLVIFLPRYVLSYTAFAEIGRGTSPPASLFPSVEPSGRKNSLTTL